MTGFFSGNALWHLIMQSDAVSKAVMLLLLGMSLICWTLFFYKLMGIRLKKKQLLSANARLKESPSLDHLLALASAYSNTAPGYFLTKNLAVLKQIVDSNYSKNRPINEQQWNLFEQTMQQTVDEMMEYEESGLSFLSASAAVSPLLGLFGTVWGLVHSFISISEKQSADITTVAPGLAEALMTTLAGLLVAIPALVMFHYLSLQIARFGSALISMSDKFNFAVQKLFYW